MEDDYGKGDVDDEEEGASADGTAIQPTDSSDTAAAVQEELDQTLIRDQHHNPPPSSSSSVSSSAEHEHTYVMLPEGRIAIVLPGRITPPLLKALAAQRVSVPVISNDARRSNVFLFYAGSTLRVGPYAIDLHTYDECGKYTCHDSSASQQLLPPHRFGGGVMKLHRKRRDEFERR